MLGRFYLPKGTMALPLYVAHASRVYDKSYHPRSVPIVVTEKSAVAGAKPAIREAPKLVREANRTTYYAHPEYIMAEESNENAADAVAPVVR